VDGVVRRITADFGNGYFVTGVIDSAVYDEQCTFVDPTISVRLSAGLRTRRLSCSGRPLVLQPRLVRKEVTLIHVQHEN
jgi:vacuolar-type H+-ATPase subunit B/Vma2